MFSVVRVLGEEKLNSIARIFFDYFRWTFFSTSIIHHHIGNKSFSVSYKNRREDKCGVVCGLGLQLAKTTTKTFLE